MRNIVIALTSVLMATSSAFGMRQDRGSERARLVSQTEVIRLKGEVFRGENVIRLRKALRDQGVDMRGKAVKSVTVVAKSRQGRGKARLIVGREISAPARVDLDKRVDDRGERRGLRQLFNAKGGMNRITIQSPVGARRQLNRDIRKAQLRLNGNIKVARVRVELVSKEKRRPKPRKRTDEEIVIDLIGGIIGGIIENERDKKRRKP